MNPAVRRPAIKVNARRCLPFASTAHMCVQADSVRGAPQVAVRARQQPDTRTG